MLKLNGIKFHGKSVFLEEAMFTGKKVNSGDKENIKTELKLS